MLAYPVAYWIAFRGGARKSTYLFLLLLPFFVSFVLRTISWKFILTDDGMLLEPLKAPAPGAGRTSTSSARLAAVIGGLTYNYLPFMVLPIYVALERIDPRVLEAARDLYATPARRVPAGDPAAVPARGVRRRADDVRAGQLRLRQRRVLGGTRQHDDRQHHPDAVPGQRRTTRPPSALSFMLMAVMLIGIFLYARALGTEDVLEVAAR